MQVCMELQLRNLSTEQTTSQGKLSLQLVLGTFQMQKEDQRGCEDTKPKSMPFSCDESRSSGQERHDRNVENIF